MTATIIARHTIFVALLLSNGFYGVGEFNDETHQITKLFHDDLTDKNLAIRTALVLSIVNK